MGPLVWPQLAAAYIEAKLRPIQPQSDAEVGDRQAVLCC